MFAKTEEVKVLRDPVHGYIHVEYVLIWDLINSAWFQRLRRIRQLGGACMVYHTADHTRFGHSLGVYEIVRRMTVDVEDLKNTLSEKEKVTVMAAGLLHDLGHGPYSHAFESVLGTSHEEYTCRIIEEDPEISGILESACAGLSKDVADVIRHKGNPLLSALVSGQLDADRMDYLLRDAYFTGTKYGEFDLERILRILRRDGDRVVVKESGVYAVENYIMARYHMYWQVYYHPVARSYEAILRAMFHRLKVLNEKGKLPASCNVLRPLFSEGGPTLQEYFCLDENVCAYCFAMLRTGRDPILRDLANRLLDRNLFDFMEASDANVHRVREVLKKERLDPVYYLARDEVGQKPYVPYSEEHSNAIWVRMHGGTIKELSSASAIVFSLVHGPQTSDDRIYYPKGLFSD